MVARSSGSRAEGTIDATALTVRFCGVRRFVLPPTLVTSKVFASFLLGNVVSSRARGRFKEYMR